MKIQFSTSSEKKIVYFDMDNTLVDFQSGIDALTDDQRKEYEGRLDEVPGIFGKMKPLIGAIPAWSELTRLFDCYVLSTAPWENPSSLPDKLAWVKKYLGQAAHKRVIFSHNKHLNAGDYLIDDRTANGAGNFKGRHIHFGQAPFETWPKVVAYLKRSNNL